MGAKTKIIKEAFDALAKNFSNVMQIKSGGSGLTSTVEMADSPVPKLSDLDSVRNSEQFKSIKQSVASDSSQPLKDLVPGVEGKFLMSDSALNENVAEMFDTEVFGSMPNSDMWDDFSNDEIKAMYLELKSKNLNSEEIVDYFEALGNVNERASNIVKMLSDADKGG